MKKSLALVAAILFAYQFSNAQTQKGKQTFGLDGGYSHITVGNSPNPYNGAAQQETKSTNARIGPSYGYFIANGSEIGGSLFYAYYRQTNNINYPYPMSVNFFETKTNSFGASAFFRKYVLYQNKIGFRTGPYASYQWGKNDYTTIPGVAYCTKSSGYAVGGNFDLVYYPTAKFGLAATIANLSYTRNKNKNDKYYSHDENCTFRFIKSGLSLTAFYSFGGI